MEIWQWLGSLHPKLVMFPLVLLLVGLLFDLGGILSRSARAHWAGLIVTGLGTVGLLFAFICGIYAEIWAGRAGISQHAMELHESMANIAAWGFVILFAWRIFLSEKTATQSPSHSAESCPASRSMRIYVALGLAWYLLLALTGWLGGKLVFEYGAAVGAATGGNDIVLTLSDLNTLGARQTDLNLRYSEWMHHIFGFMTLGLSASLLAQALWPKHAKHFRWIVPTFLLAGGIFLFFRADSDLYAFTDMRQWRDREVQLHKSLATIMTTIGAVGLWKLFRQRKRAAESPGLPTGAPNVDTPKASDANSKLVAVMALIGGSLLFTHVHSVAPYANVAAGVYIAHVVLGVIALSIGASRWMQDFFPKRRRELGLIFAGLMLIESLLLITYNEGLPWFIGYGDYERWGPEKDPSVTIAPFGSFRALLVVDQPSGNLFIAFRKRFDNEAPVELSFDAMPVLVLTQGAKEIAIPLAKAHVPKELQSIAAPESGSELVGTNFSAQADFIKSTPWLNAKLVLHLNGKERIGYFDPWVVPTIHIVPPNELAIFECPMHEGMRSMTADKCPLCGMDMIPILPPRMGNGDTFLHDPGYDLSLIQKGAATRGQNATSLNFSIAPTKNRDAIKNLAIVHEQPIHLIVVSSDLTYFDHIHPIARTGMGEEGLFDWHYTFPHAGEYLLFAEFTPRGDRMQTVRMPITVGDVPPGGATAPALSPDVALTKLMQTAPAGKTPQDSAPWIAGAPPTPFGPEGAQVQLLTQPRTIYAGLHNQLIFRLADARGNPLSDLKPYLGALGHCIAISEDTNLMIHSHPIQWNAVPEKGGPVVAFETLFPTTGKWRIWAQFKRPGEGTGSADRIINAEFTVEVQKPLVPVSLIRWFIGD